MNKRTELRIEGNTKGLLLKERGGEEKRIQEGDFYQCTGNAKSLQQ